MFSKVSITLCMIFAITIAYAEADSPETINLKDAWDVKNATRSAVVFEHAAHQGNNECTACHDSDQGGKLKPEKEIKGMTDKNPAHAFCWDCHTKKRVPGMKNCAKCHE